MSDYKNIFDPNTLSDRVVRLAHLNFTLNEFTNLLQLLGVEYEESSYYLEDSVLQKVVHIHTGIGKVEMSFDTEHGFLRYTIIRHIPAETYADHGYDVEMTVRKANFVENRHDKEPEPKEVDAPHPRKRAKTSQ